MKKSNQMKEKSSESPTQVSRLSELFLIKTYLGFQGHYNKNS